MAFSPRKAPVPPLFFFLDTPFVRPGLRPSFRRRTNGRWLIMVRPWLVLFAVLEQDPPCIKGTPPLASRVARNSSQPRTSSSAGVYQFFSPSFSCPRPTLTVKCSGSWLEPPAGPFPLTFSPLPDANLRILETNLPISGCFFVFFSPPLLLFSSPKKCPFFFRRSSLP